MMDLLEQLQSLPFRERVGCLAQWLAFLIILVAVTVVTVVYGM
ncbi:MAG: hypothetical protein RBT75_09945 [Anaerolineae bacterium]|jgi:hypothetical protein|nr:hypothetical protein [Anaerolineae bacterium]